MLRIWQLAAADAAHRVEQLLRGRLTPLQRIGKRSVAGVWLPVSIELEMNCSDQQTRAIGLFKDTIPVSEFAICCGYNLLAASDRIEDINPIYISCQFNTIGADVLNWSRTGCARNQSQVFKPMEPITHTSFNQAVPVLAGSDLDRCIIMIQLDACHGHSHNQSGVIARKKHIGPLTQDAYRDSLGVGKIQGVNQLTLGSCC